MNFGPVMDRQKGMHVSPMWICTGLLKKGCDFIGDVLLLENLRHINISSKKIHVASRDFVFSIKIEVGGRGVQAILTSSS